MAALKTEETSSSASRFTYHVFLSFRGEDTRKNFTDHLYTALLNAGIHTFRDDDELERGENIESELQKAINGSRISLIVLSKDYASSRWCLDELARILERKRTDGHEVLPVFYDVVPSQVESQSGCFADAFKRHEERFKSEMEKVEGWKRALREVANLGPMVLQYQANGHESMFIQEIVKNIGTKLKRTVLSVAMYSVGIESRVKDINLWLQDGSTDVGIGVIRGMGGIGKTTIAKVAFNSNFERFEASSFLANVRETSEQPNGLVRLQRQLLADILKGRKEKIHNVDGGIITIKDSICRKRILVVLDDVDRVEWLNDIIGMPVCFYPGSKIIITTRREHLLKAHGVHETTFKITELDYDESFQLFSRHAFGQDHPSEGYMEHSKRVIKHCGGLPLALEVLGSTLSGRSIEVWKSAVEKLESIPDEKIQKSLEVSYKSLQDDHDKNLFLKIASSFVGMDKDYVAKILEDSHFYPTIGIQNLIDRCLITIDSNNKLMMHQLIQDMGKEIIRQESLEEPGKHTILGHHGDSFNILRDKADQQTIERLEKYKSGRTILNISGAKRHHSEAFPDKSMLPYHGNSLKRRLLDFFSWLPLTADLTKLFPGKGGRLGN